MHPIMPLIPEGDSVDTTTTSLITCYLHKRSPGYARVQHWPCHLASDNKPRDCQPRLVGDFCVSTNTTEPNVDMGVSECRNHFKPHSPRHFKKGRMLSPEGNWISRCLVKELQSLFEFT